MKTITNLCFCLLLFGTINAQRSTVAHEQINDDGHYKFWVEAENAAVDQLVDLYFQISQQSATAEFKGTQSHTLQGGAILSIDTEMQELAIVYEGTDDKMLTRVKGLGQKVTKYLEGADVEQATSLENGSEQTTVPTRNTVAVTNSGEGNYNFYIVVAEDQLTELLTTFTDLSGQQLADDFEGQEQFTLDGGIIMSIDTDSYKLTVDYEGSDRSAKNRAKVIGERANAYLGNHGQR